MNVFSKYTLLCALLFISGNAPLHAQSDTARRAQKLKRTLLIVASCVAVLAIGGGVSIWALKKKHAQNTRPIQTVTRKRTASLSPSQGRQKRAKLKKNRDLSTIEYTQSATRRRIEIARRKGDRPAIDVGIFVTRDRNLPRNIGLTPERNQSRYQRTHVENKDELLNQIHSDVSSD